MTMKRTRQTRSNITQSQVRDLTSYQPLRSSAMKPRAASDLTTAGTRSAARKAALTRNVALSTAMATACDKVVRSLSGIADGLTTLPTT